MNDKEEAAHGFVDTLSYQSRNNNLNSLDNTNSNLLKILNDPQRSDFWGTIDSQTGAAKKGRESDIITILNESSTINEQTLDQKQIAQLRSIVESQQRKPDFSFLKPVTTKKKIVDLFIKAKASIHPTLEEEEEVKEEEVKEQTEANQNTQTEHTKPPHPASFVEMIKKLKELKKQKEEQEGLKEPEQPQSPVRNNILTNAFESYLEKKRKEQMDRDQYFNQVFLEARESY